MFLRHLGITKKITLALLLLGSVFGGVAATVFTSLDRSQDAAEANRNSTALSAYAHQMMSNVLEQQNAIRAYAILGKESFLTTYEENRNALRKTGARFQALASQPEQRRLMRTFLAAERTWHATKLDRTIALAADPATRAEAQQLAGVKQLGDMRDAMKAIDAFQDERQTAHQREQDSADRIARLSILVGGALTLGLAALICVALSRAIAGPIVDLTATMGRLAGGDNETAIAGEDRGDEIGRMAKAVLVFRDAAVEKARVDAEQARMIEAVATGLGKLAAADLTMRLSGLPADYVKLEQDFNAATQALATALRAVSRSTAAVNTSASEIRGASDQLSLRTEQQAASLEETAAAMDEITSTVRRTAEDANRANGAVAAARAEAEQSGEIVTRAVTAMGGIERSSSEISEIITVIDGIAFQTNLLALNAGVEAARAGDAGKGFAVVASEVRALAQRSADAAKDVKTRILASSHEVEAGVRLVSDAGEALERIIGRIGDISTLITDINAAAKQQASGLEQVNIAVGEMDGATQQNAAMVEEATAAARSLATEAEELAQQIGKFTLAGADTGSSGEVVQLVQARSASANRTVRRERDDRQAVVAGVARR